VTTILKFVRECTSILATQVDSPALALRLFLAAQIASECGSRFEDLVYNLYVQVFSVCEYSIPESLGQFVAITRAGRKGVRNGV
jgi:vacuolar protein sorting-associated protein 35